MPNERGSPGGTPAEPESRRPGQVQPLGGLLPLVLALGFLAGSYQAGLGQEAPLPLSGRVLVGDAPADSGTVVLHRVSALFSGEVDSVSVGQGGSFMLSLPEAPNPAGGDVFFASLRYDDVLYFGPAITDREVLDSLYLIHAYPARPAVEGAVLPVRVRNLFLERTDTGWVATDLFEVENASAETVVAGEGSASWVHALPPSSTDFQVGQSDLSPDAASFSDGRIAVSAPIPPGESVYLVRYRIPSEGVVVPVASGTASMELLIREPAGDLDVTGLAATEVVEVDGNTYRRFAGRGMASSLVTVTPGEAFNVVESIPLLGVLLTLVLAGAGALVVFRSQSRSRASGRRTRRSVLVDVARLDQSWQAGTMGVEEYDRRRKQLLEELQP